MAPSSLRATVIGSATFKSKVPLGPLTETFWPSIVTSTPVGTRIGCFPMRDMATPSPHVHEDFAAHALSGCLTVGEQSRRGRDDRHAQAAEHPRQAGGLRVDPQSRFGHPPQTGDAAFPAGPVLELHGQRLADAGVFGVVVADVTLPLEDLGGVAFLAVVPGPGLPRPVLRIGSVVCLVVSRCYQLLFCTPGSSPACAISRRQILHSPNLR